MSAINKLNEKKDGFVLTFKNVKEKLTRSNRITRFSFPSKSIFFVRIFCDFSIWSNRIRIRLESKTVVLFCRSELFSVVEKVSSTRRFHSRETVATRKSTEILKSNILTQIFSRDFYSDSKISQVSVRTFPTKSHRNVLDLTEILKTRIGFLTGAERIRKSN